MTAFQLGRWDPFRDLTREVGRFLQSIEPLHNLRLPRPFPAINIYEAPDRFVLACELPGVSAEEVDLSITGETLTLRGERRRPEGVDDERYRRQERYFGRWQRNVTLPERVDGSRIAAEMSHGILTVTLPKSEQVRPRQIPVTTPAL